MFFVPREVSNLNNLTQVVLKSAIRLKLFHLKHNFSDKLDDKGNIVQPITRPIVPSGGVLKDINNKIEKLQHESKVIIRRF